MQAQATFKTERADRFMRALCHHFGRRVDARCGAEAGDVTFPFGRCEMTSGGGALTLRAFAEDPDQLDRLTQVVGSHLERFAFSENPDLQWHTDAGAPLHD